MIKPSDKYEKDYFKTDYYNNLNVFRVYRLQGEYNSRL